MKKRLRKVIVSIVIPLFLLITALWFLPQIIQDATEEKISETFDDLSFYLHLNGENKIEIEDYGDGEAYVFFLPSCCETKDVSVETRNGITLRKSEEEEKFTVENGETLKNIEINTPYMLGCYDKNQYLYEIPVRFMKAENTGAMFVSTESGSIEKVLKDKNYKEDASAVIADKQGKIQYQGELSYIKGRGNGSWFSAKKPFNIKLKEKADIFGMGEARKFSLLSQEQDPSLLRNKISYDVAKLAEMPYSPDSEFVDLWIDGAYYGLYLLTDRIDVSAGSVNISDLEMETEAVNLEELPVYERSEQENPNLRYSKIPNSPEDVTGGYLFEIDEFYKEEKEAYIETEVIDSVTFKAPEYISKEQAEYAAKYLAYVEECIVNGADREYENCIDTDSWVKMAVIQEAFGNKDFMGSSQYFYKEKDKNGKYAKLYAGPLWDMDNSLGNGNEAPAVNQLVIPESSWFGNLYGRKEFYEQIKTCYRDVFRPLFEKLLKEGVVKYAEDISKSYEMNAVRWGYEESQEEQTKQLQDFMQERIEWLDGLWVNGEEYCMVTVTESRHGKNDDTYLVKTGETLTGLDEPQKTGYIFDGWYYGTLYKMGSPYDKNIPVTEDIHITAKLEKVNDFSAEELIQRGYQLNECEDLNVYLRLLEQQDYAVVMGLSSNSGKLYDRVAEAMEILGIKTDFETLENSSYYAFLYEGKQIEEKSAVGPLNVSGKLPNGSEFTVSCETSESEGSVSLRLEGADENLFVNEKGLNMAVFDMSGDKPVLVDSVCFDLLYNGACSRG